MTGIWITLFVLVVGTAVALIYNGLVRARNEAENGWSQIDVQLKRRHDLIPNLVATVKGARDFEQEVLEKLTQARAQAQGSLAGGAASVAQIGMTETMLSQALGGFFATVENYPDLKTGQNFLALQEELSSTENRIAFARQAFNDAVALYNTRRETFPGVLFSGGFPRREFLQIEEQERALPSSEI